MSNNNKKNCFPNVSVLLLLFTSVNQLRLLNWPKPLFFIFPFLPVAPSSWMSHLFSNKRKCLMHMVAVKKCHLQTTKTHEILTSRYM